MKRIHYSEILVNSTTISKQNISIMDLSICILYYRFTAKWTIIHEMVLNDFVNNKQSFASKRKTRNKVKTIEKSEWKQLQSFVKWNCIQTKTYVESNCRPGTSLITAIKLWIFVIFFCNNTYIRYRKINWVILINLYSSI